jgi:hypothetical protein
MAPVKPRSEWTAADYRERTENARRTARFKSAKARIEDIVRTAPRLTPEQFAELRSLLPAPSGGDRAAS